MNIKLSKLKDQKTKYLQKKKINTDDSRVIQLIEYIIYK